MRKVLAKRQQLETPKPIGYIVNPMDREFFLKAPVITYTFSANFEPADVYKGEVYPIPKIIPYILTQKPLIVYCIIFDEMMKNGVCGLSIREIALHANMTPSSTSGVLFNLKKCGIIVEAVKGNNRKGRIRKINFKAIQHLNDILQDEQIGIFARLSEIPRKFNLANITKEDVRSLYSQQYQDPNEDPIEYEEYT